MAPRCHRSFTDFSSIAYKNYKTFPFHCDSVTEIVHGVTNTFTCQVLHFLSNQLHVSGQCPYQSPKHNSQWCVHLCMQTSGKAERAAAVREPRAIIEIPLEPLEM